MLLLDEPTSGLDSFKAHLIVKLLRNQARKGRTVIATIHQPSSDSFLLFDSLILMIDGYIIYQGQASRITAYFKKIGFPCPRFSNPADFYMRILSVEYPKTEKDEKKIKYLLDKYNELNMPLI